jgi:hypothetical protein
MKSANYLAIFATLAIVVILIFMLNGQSFTEMFSSSPIAPPPSPPKPPAVVQGYSAIPGDFYTPNLPFNISPQQCADYCKNTPTCVGFITDAAGTQCFLKPKSSIGTRVTNGNFIYVQPGISVT